MKKYKLKTIEMKTREESLKHEMWAIRHKSFSKNYGNDVMAYDEAKIFNQALGFKSKEEYAEFWQMFKPAYLPENPEEYYKLNK